MPKKLCLLFWMPKKLCLLNVCTFYLNAGNIRYWNCVPGPAAIFYWIIKILAFKISGKRRKKLLKVKRLSVFLETKRVFFRNKKILSAFELFALQSVFVTSNSKITIPVFVTSNSEITIPVFVTSNSKITIPVLQITFYFFSPTVNF